MVRTTVDIEEKNWNLFRKKLVDEKMTIREAINNLIRKYIKKHGGSKNGIHKP